MNIAQTVWDALLPVFGDGLHWNKLPQRDDPSSNARPALVVSYQDNFLGRVDCNWEERKLLLMTTLWVNQSCCTDLHAGLCEYRARAEGAIKGVFGDSVRASFRPFPVPRELGEYAESVDFVVEYTRKL